MACYRDSFTFYFTLLSLGFDRALVPALSVVLTKLNTYVHRNSLSLHILTLKMEVQIYTVKQHQQSTTMKD
jgi:hypothetical protein